MIGTPYHKIHSLFKRDEKGKIFFGEWARPEIGYLASLPWVCTEKVDGMNIRIGLNEERKLVIGGRTDRAQIPGDLVRNILDMELEEKLQEFEPGTVLYGEGYGAGIQKGDWYRDDKSFILFDVNIGGTWLERNNIEDIGDTLGVDVVPLMGVCNLFDAIHFVQAGLVSLIAREEDHLAEGLVCVPSARLHNFRGERIITKVKTKDLYHGN